MGILSLVLLATVGAAAAEDAPPVWETPHFRFHAPPELADAADFYRQELEAARRRAREHWSIPLNTPVDVFLWPRDSWQTLTSENPAMRDVLAFVRSNDQSMVINHAGCRRAGVGRLRQTLVHEYVHVHLGQMIARWPPSEGPPRLPRWLEEGLALAVADETRLWDTALLCWQGPKRMIALMDLAEDFPGDPGGQKQAYRQSADAVAFLIEERGGLGGLIDEIVDPERGPDFLRDAWDPGVIAGLESRWHATLRLGWRWSSAWVLVLILAAFAWRRRRRLARRKVARWAMEAEGLIPGGLDEEEQDRAVDRVLRGE
jgi:hypothetical protein